MTLFFTCLMYSFSVLSDPVKRLDYDMLGNYEIDKYSLGVSIIVMLLRNIGSAHGLYFVWFSFNLWSHLLAWHLCCFHKCRNILLDSKEWYLRVMALELIMLQFGILHSSYFFISFFTSNVLCLRVSWTMRLTMSSISHNDFKV